MLADVASGAVRVPLALPAAPCDGVRLGDVGGQAPADGVPSPRHCALSVGPAGAGGARVRLLNTPLALADVASLAVRVPHTLWPTAGDGVRLGDQPRVAPTDGVAIEVKSAAGPGTAGAGVAGVRPLHTSLVCTDITTLTVGVPQTLWLAAGDRVRVGDQIGFTPADSVSRARDLTEGPRATGRGDAGIGAGHAPLALAHQTLLTVWVPHTLWTTASDRVRLGDQSRSTPADCVAGAGDGTDSSRTARRRNTGVGLLHTSASAKLLALAHQTPWTVGVCQALWATACDGVWLGDQPRLALADSVALRVSVTYGPWAAGVGVAGVLRRLASRATDGEVSWTKAKAVVDHNLNIESLVDMGALHAQ